MILNEGIIFNFLKNYLSTILAILDLVEVLKCEDCLMPICEGDLRFRTKLFSGILHALGEEKFDQIIGADPSPGFQFKNNNISLPKKPLGLALSCKNAPLALCCWQTLSLADWLLPAPRARGAKLISACAVITLLHHNHYVALETRWNLLAPQYVCEREECVLHPVLQKSPAHTQSGTRGPPPPTHRMQTLSLADNKKGERIFYVIITSTFKVERIIVKFYERWRECTPLRYENKSACESADMDFTPA